MPCNSIITQRVSIPAMRPDLLRAALGLMGAGNISVDASGVVRYRLDYQAWTVQGGELRAAGVSASIAGSHADRLRRAYSTVAVQYAAASAGFKVRQVGGKMVAYKG